MTAISKNVYIKPSELVKEYNNSDNENLKIKLVHVKQKHISTLVVSIKQKTLNLRLVIICKPKSVKKIFRRSVCYQRGQRHNTVNICDESSFYKQELHKNRAMKKVLKKNGNKLYIKCKI